MESDMNEKAMPENPKTKDRFKWFKGVQYWIAIISYVVILSLSILCLAVYIPHLSDTEVIDSGSLNILMAFVIIILVFATAFFLWEMRQWRRGRSQKQQLPSLEDAIKDFKKNSTGND